MQLTVLGLNHRTAPVEIRERFNFSNDRVASILRRLRNYDNIPEAMLLSTCNRTELYMVIENPHEAIPFIKSLLKHLAGEHYQSEYFYNLNGTNCVKHLFRVASSLDSLIVGEGQILSQIKNAYQIARNNGMTDTILNTIMNKAIAVGKRVRTETKIAYSSVSVSSAAVDLAIKILAELGPAPLIFIFVTESPFERHGDFALTCPYVRTHTKVPQSGLSARLVLKPLGSRTHIKGCAESTRSQQRKWYNLEK